MTIPTEDVAGLDFSDLAGAQRIGAVTPGDVLREEFMIPLGSRPERWPARRPSARSNQNGDGPMISQPWPSQNSASSRSVIAANSRCVRCCSSISPPALAGV